MIDAVVARLKDQVSDLRSVEGAAEYRELLAQGRPPVNDPAAYVIPLGLRAGKTNAVAGMFTQEFAEAVGVVLFLRGQDRTGKRVLERLRPFLFDIITAIAGWQPVAEGDVFQLTRASLVDMSRGLMTYQIDFSITDQLRIPG